MKEEKNKIDSYIDISFGCITVNLFVLEWFGMELTCKTFSLFLDIDTYSENDFNLNSLTQYIGYKNYVQFLNLFTVLIFGNISTAKKNEMNVQEECLNFCSTFFSHLAMYSR